MGALKFVNLEYKNKNELHETIILLGFCLIESIRIHLGRKGSLSEHGESLMSFLQSQDYHFYC